MRNRVPKKVQCLNSGQKDPAAEKAQVITELRQFFDLEVLLAQSGMARSSYYYHEKQGKQADKYKDIKEQISQIYHRHKGRYGYRRIRLELIKSGIRLNHKTVLSLMVTLGLKSVIRVKKYRSYKGFESNTAPNILRRRFSADRPNEKWATDITEFNVAGSKLYLSPIIDLFNGEIISFELSERPVFQQVVEMLGKSFKNRLCRQGCCFTLIRDGNIRRRSIGTC